MNTLYKEKAFELVKLFLTYREEISLFDSKVSGSIKKESIPFLRYSPP